jgi:hypothetical protein
VWGHDLLRLAARFGEDRGEPIFRMNATSLPRAASHPAPFIVAAVLSAALLPLAMDDMPRAIRYGGITRALITAIVCGLCIWVAFRPGVARAWWAHVRASERVNTVTRWACVLHGPILVALFYLMWFAGRLTLGFWPPAAPMYDPKGMPATAVIYLLIYGWVWLAAVALVLALYQLGRAIALRPATAFRRFTDLCTMIGLWVPTIVYFAVDPNDLLKWFFD